MLVSTSHNASVVRKSQTLKTTETIDNSVSFSIEKFFHPFSLLFLHETASQYAISTHSKHKQIHFFSTPHNHCSHRCLPADAAAHLRWRLSLSDESWSVIRFHHLNAPSLPPPTLHLLFTKLSTALATCGCCTLQKATLPSTSNNAEATVTQDKAFNRIENSTTFVFET